MGFNPKDLSDKDFIFAYAPEYLDDELSSEERDRYDEILKSDATLANLPSRYMGVRGRFQLALQSYYLRENDLMKLHSFVEDPDLRKTEEAARIDDVERKEMFGGLRRRIALVVVLVAVVFGVFYVMTPRKQKKFDALEYLGYESLAMDEDADGRLDLPTNEIDEITQYLGAYPALDFKPLVMKPIGKGWIPEGATVIDYEVSKVAVVKYRHNEQKDTLYHYTFAGALKDLPKSDPGNYRGLVFQTYASDQLNIIAWQQESGMLCFLVGRRSAPELANLARTGTSN